MSRVVERTKRCGGCGEVKPWSAYWAHAKWPDGSMQRPQSRCKKCMREAAAERSRARRVRMHRDPEFRRDYLAKQLEWSTTWRRKNGVQPRLAECAGAVDGEVGGRLALEPWRSWLLEQLESFDGNELALSRWLGVSDASVRRWLASDEADDDGFVLLDHVDRVLCRIGEPGALREIWPELYADPALCG